MAQKKRNSICFSLTSQQAFSLALPSYSFSFHKILLNGVVVVLAVDVWVLSVSPPHIRSHHYHLASCSDAFMLRRKKQKTAIQWRIFCFPPIHLPILAGLIFCFPHASTIYSTPYISHNHSLYLHTKRCSQRISI